MATNPNGMNNSGDASAMTATADCAIDEESGPTHVPASSVVASATETVSSSGSAAESQQPPKSNEVRQTTTTTGSICRSVGDADGMIVVVTT